MYTASRFSIYLVKQLSIKRVYWQREIRLEFPYSWLSPFIFNFTLLYYSLTWKSFSTFFFYPRFRKLSKHLSRIIPQFRYKFLAFFFFFYTHLYSFPLIFFSIFVPSSWLIHPYHLTFLSSASQSKKFLPSRKYIHSFFAFYHREPKLMSHKTCQIHFGQPLPCP